MSDASQEPAQPVQRVALGSDHGGFEAKEFIKKYLQTLGYTVVDVGTGSRESVDYPDLALKVARKVASGDCDRGIMIDGAGIGSCMVCNKVKGIRAAMCYDQKTAVNSREHNNANVLAVGGRILDRKRALEIVRAFLETPFAGDRHQRRIDKITNLEKR